MDVVGAVEPGLLSADGRLCFAHHERQAVDEQHQVVAAVLVSRCEGHLGRDHEVVRRGIVEVDQPHRHVILGVEELQRLAPAQPGGHLLVGGDEPVVDDRQQRGSEAGQHLLDAFGPLRDHWVQPDEGGGDVLLEEDAIELAGQVVRGDEPPPDVGPRQPV